jgi:DNA-directed RNA polymerase subunit alpha
MAVKYGKFEMPQDISVDESVSTPKFARFIAEPFERGVAHTVANSLRRTMLSSLEAPAIITVRLEGVPHEFMPIDGVKEDMTNIVLNLKGALLRKLPTDESPSSRDQRILTNVVEVSQGDIDKGKGQYVVTLGDIVQEGNFEVVNPELPLFTVTRPIKKQIDLRVAFGRGYVPSERHIVRDRTSDEILIDAAFSPVRLVNYFVENTRVGQDTDYDRLIIEVTTDGRITPIEALTFASQIGVKHLEVFNKIKTHSLLLEEGIMQAPTDRDEMMEKLSLRIDEIELSVRSANCLSGANIDTIGELVSIPERKMLEFRNFGKKSLNEIKAKLHEMGLSLGMDLSKYGITSETIKERMREFHDEKKGRKETGQRKEKAKEFAE